MWMYFISRAAISSFAMGCSCAIAIYTGKTPLKVIKEEKK